MRSNELQIVNTHLPVGSLEAYIDRVNHIPMLSEQEEKDLAEKLQTEGDLIAAQRLVTSHLRYVVKVAKGYMGYGLQLSDLLQEGTIGLMKAVKRFQPEKGVRLVSFAVHWIKAEIHEFVLKNWRIVKVATTKAQRKLFFNLRKSTQNLGSLTNKEVNEIAVDLGVKPEEVIRMEQRLSAHDSSFDLPSYDDDGGARCSTSLSPTEYLVSADQDPLLRIEQENWDTHISDKFSDAFATLDERSKDILDKRWLREDNKATLQDLAAEYNVSAERIRQLEKNAMLKLQQAITNSE
jgi:RNA polymerase sigma-32 factor